MDDVDRPGHVLTVGGVEPDRAHAELPVRVQGARPHQRVVGDGGGAGQRDGREPVADLDAAALGDRVGAVVVDDGVVVTAVDGEVVRQDRQLHGVVGDGVVGVGDPVGPQRDAVVAGVANVGVGDRGVGDTAVEVDPVGDGVLDPHVADLEVGERAGHPDAGLDVLDPHVADRGVLQAAADAHEVFGVDAGVDLAVDGEVGQVDVGARGWREVAEDADAVAAKHRVPFARPGQGHVVDDQVRGDEEVARRDIDRLACRAAGVDRVLDGCRRVGLTGRVRPVGQHRDRAPRPRRGRRDLLEVGHVERDRDRRVGDLETYRGARGQGPAEQAPHVVVHVVAAQGGRVVGERVAAVEPVVGRRQGQVGSRLAVDVYLQRRGLPGPGGRVRDRVAQVDRVSRLHQGELDVLACAVERDRGAPDRLGRQRVEVVRRPDHGAVVPRVDRRVLGERDLGAAAAVGCRDHLAIAGISSRRASRRGACRSHASGACQCYERRQRDPRGEASCEHGPPPFHGLMNAGTSMATFFPRSSPYVTRWVSSCNNKSVIFLVSASFMQHYVMNLQVDATLPSADGSVRPRSCPPGQGRQE